LVDLAYFCMVLIIINTKKTKGHVIWFDPELIDDWIIVVGTLYCNVVTYVCGYKPFKCPNPGTYTDCL